MNYILHFIRYHVHFVLLARFPISGPQLLQLECNRQERHLLVCLENAGAHYVHWTLSTSTSISRKKTHKKAESIFMIMPVELQNHCK